MGVVFTRVDERMIHGQVMSAWAKVLSIDEVILVNDKVVHDDFQKSVMEISVPTGIELRIVSVDDAYEILSHADFDGSRTMVLFRDLHDAVRMVDKGYTFDSIDIGGIYHKEGKTEYAKALSLDQNDMKDLRMLLDKKIDVFFQVAPMTQKDNIEKYIKT